MTKKKRLFIILAIVLAVLIAVGVVLAVIFTRNSTPETPGGTQGGNEQPGGTQGGNEQPGGTQGGGTQPGGTQGGGTQGDGTQGGGTQGGGTQGGGTQGGGTQGGGTQGGGTQGGGTQGGGTQGGGTEHTHDMTKHEKQEPTCTAEGTITYWHCSGCNKNYLDEEGTTEAGDLTIPKLDHNMTEHKQQDPTCTSTGTKAHWHCSGCQKDYLDPDGTTEAGDLTIEKLEHDMTEHKQQDPTCTSTGTKAHWHCSGCNKNYLDPDGTTEAGDLTIEKLDHTPEEYIELQPTCDVPGKKYQRCSVCHTPLSGEEEISVLGHDWGDWEYNGDAKCEMDGTETKRCKRVGCVASETRTKEGSALEHDYDENGKCRREGCGDTNGPKTPSSGGSISQGDKVLFGSYPQTEVKDDELKSALTSQAGTLPTEQSAGKWTDYGYYYGTDNSGSEAVHSYMWYQDVSYGGEKYRGVYFTSYRPSYTSYISSTGNSHQDDNGYNTKTVYWFQYEPIEWRVLEQKNGTALLLANIILDSQAYQSEYEYQNREYYTYSNGAPAGTYANNYKYSTIRSWLRDTFYETAFDESAKSLIETTEVDNSAATTWSSSNRHACENTQDKVFLLSYQDVLNTSYGFSSNDLDDAARRLKCTDYAKSQGVGVYYSYDDNGHWWLRSPTLGSGNGACTVIYDGGAYNSSNVRATYGGVVPALRIKLSESSTPETPTGDPVWKDDHTVLFGSYPQTEVKDSALKSTLTSQAGTLPTEQNAGKWTDYGYYYGTDNINSEAVHSYMWYQDVSYGGEKYRGVYFTSYRPSLAQCKASAGSSNQDDNGYDVDTVYWFQFEPIEWRVLEQKNGTALLMANIILDSQQYYHTGFDTRSTIDGKMVYPNNYAESDIRAWLRDTFYETAFDEYAKSLIETTEVDNSAASTPSSNNSYACENTQDKVFLLSYQDVLNTSYGFSSSDIYDTARQLKSTDYAKSQGVRQSTDSRYRGNGSWWLRSPWGSYSYSAYMVPDNSDIYTNGVGYTDLGVVPALRIKL